MRLLVCGSRALSEVHLPMLRSVLGAYLRASVPYDSGFVFAHGAARGADTLWEEAFVWLYEREPALWMPVRRFPARWREEGRQAGPLRNRRMFEVARPTHFLAAHNREDLGSGTADMVFNVLRPAGVSGAVMLLGESGEVTKTEVFR